MPTITGGLERAQHLAQVLLRLARPVGRRGVEVVDPVLERARDPALTLGRRAPHHRARPRRRSRRPARRPSVPFVPAFGIPWPLVIPRSARGPLARRGTVVYSLISMRHTRLGRTGLPVSRLCLGTMTFGLQCDEPTSLAILDRAAAGGITFLDTADVYPLGGGLETVGRTEEIVGRWLEGRAPRLRARHQVLRRDERAAVGPRHLAQAHPRRDRRLAAPPAHRLRRPLPAPPPRSRRRRSTRRCARSTTSCGPGKVRYVGCSNFLAYQVARALGRSEALGLARFDSVQPRYNLLFRQIERELLPLCREEGIGVIPYNPLAGGLLSGKHRRDAGPTAGTRFTLGNAARALPGPLLARARVRHGGGAAPARRRGRHAARRGSRSPGCSREPGDHVADRRREPARAARRRAAPPPRSRSTPTLKARLDELTREYRRGDDPR